MAAFTMTCKHEFEFAGEKVTIFFKRMTRRQTMKAAPIIAAFAKGEGEAETTADALEKKIADNAEMMLVASEIVGECLLDVSGLSYEDTSGIQPIRWSDPEWKKEILESQYFDNFIGMAFGVILANSSLMEDKAKKSEQEQPGSITE